MSQALAAEQEKSTSSIKATLTRDKLYELYVEKALSLGLISEKYNCSRQYVLLLCKEYGIDRRSKSKARLEALKRIRSTSASEASS